MEPLPSWHAEVLQLYADVDREIAAAAPRCDASGRCCRFKEYGHTLFISQLEADVLLSNAPSFQGEVTSDFCPYQVDNLCTAREPRPLGCRVYFCDPKYEGVGEQLTEKYLKRLKELADRYELGWQYAPLHRFLEGHAGTRLPTDVDAGAKRLNLL